MENCYSYTPLETYVKDLYYSLSIYRPEQLDLKLIAEKLRIRIYYEDMPSEASVYAGRSRIILDERLTPQQQWQDFGHELCHILRHVGEQYGIPSSFRLLQERQATNFMYHFCIPTFMLELLSFPWRKSEVIELISKTFNVEYEFAAQRLERWILQKESSLFYERIFDPIWHYQVEAINQKK
ncbi:ImmA/IrrE family metallo-endopeptidase [Bacillus sp. PK3_68]|uniref:ImmA/IrrE family metallo-endopeptidase n=1 Tax=Bacillus sp. PK3_68 TaxID=2027408 RepID=UPI000E70CF6C|nr:ImmA/IrrE family metallo-endopeptidase [Bacillus sp. PK3_68]RJS60155.1 hypothetical protein CJ483_08825 [Bacillus sp. PK3_68]